MKHFFAAIKDDLCEILLHAVILLAFIMLLAIDGCGLGNKKKCSKKHHADSLRINFVMFPQLTTRVLPKNC